ncbi:DNA phosphorothioation system sulfurtransferase DndC [Desulfovibrio inopinatus]|uniref:DNA phosphorothioation system sulfurtransferase DndC n=1 Tax=Desulfovibrio inopinatus TaxID=102109 RepID=UPI0003FBDB8E|nr:DNA phosphorothioation system sulfurtransferase DndC [Desulfovibrio inopinatus]
MNSIYAGRHLDDIYKEIQEQYLADSWPWILGYSGGKDSTALVQLVWHALASLEKNRLFKPIYILSSDTLVEIPKVINHIELNLKRMLEAARLQQIPIRPIKVFPDVKNTFWVNLLGKGYPAPTNNFRWCTDRLKIEPTSNFIRSQAFEASGAILLLGSRKSESSVRKKRIESHKVLGKKYNPHPDIPAAHVYTLIEDWETEEVWDYLLEYSSPWGADNRELVYMYKNASDGECPLILDIKSPSCGKSRFGCWCCTVVKNEKALSSLIKHGENWLAPLQELREILLLTQEPDKKKLYREHIKRNGQILFIRGKLEEEGVKELARGPYTMEFRKKFLRSLLQTERNLNNCNPYHDSDYINLIQQDELHEIQRLWKEEKNDWESSVYAIYEEVYGKKIDNGIDEIGFLTFEDKEAVMSICNEEGFPADLAMELLTAAQYHQGLRSKVQLKNKVAKIFSKEWRSEVEIYRDIK